MTHPRTVSLDAAIPEPGTRSALPSRIYLTGFMSSGKSTLGPPLAGALGYGFADLDALIEERAARPIPAIFAEEGEPAFRRREAGMLREASGWDRMVIALGGGALTFQENLDLARATGLVVYLRVAPEELVRRLMSTRTGRPLLLDAAGQPLSEADLRRKIDTMIALREPFYRQAHVTAEIGEQGEGESFSALLEAVRNHCLKEPGSA